MINNKRWIVSHPDRLSEEKLSGELHISRTTARILSNRGLKDPDSARKFLNPEIDDFYDPFMLLGMTPACERIKRALDGKEKVMVYGDYDVDGITATAIVVMLLESKGGDVLFYIPNRLEEGYGINKKGIDYGRANGVTLMITVDCGITAVDEARYAHESGIDMIIIDHHLPEKKMPQDCIIINPKQPGCTYPFKDLAGVGLAFKLSQAIEESKDKYLDLAAFGTVADIVPLLDENRLIVHFGLRRMTNTENIGLRELIDVSKISGKDLVPYHIGFILGPRMNAAGRLGEARRGLELLLAQEKQKANQAALELDEENNNRKKIEAEVLEDALRKVSKHIVLEENNIIVLYGAGWHLGVVGIVASKLAARFYRPVILLSGEKEAIRGSGRSIGEFNIYNAIEYCKEHLIEFGGHAYAAGLSMKQECFEKFEKMINEYASRTLSKDDLVAPIVIDSVIDIQDISFKLVTEIERLAPFGTSNLRPVFLSEKVRIKSEPQLLKKEHVKLWVSRRHEVVEIIGFNMGMRYRELLKYREIDIVYTISINEWRGQKSIQLQLKDFRPS